MPTITLYGKPGCHLCDDARAAVDAVRAGRSLQVVEVDVTLDPVLNRRYGERIPVLALDGEELFELFVDPDALAKRVAHAQAPGSAGRAATH